MLRRPRHGPGSVDRRQVEVALDQGRALLETLPYPDNLDHHFAVDPAKWDYYSMDCYRILGHGRDAGSTENRLAQAYAADVIRIGTDATGTERSPMRKAEARVTLGVVAARHGDLEQAIDYGRRALVGERVSLPHLLMVSGELASIVRQRNAAGDETAGYLDQLRQLRDPAA
jgi:hypothetical protein